MLDTGADISSLPISAAEKLGIDLSKCPKEVMIGYEGTEVSVYRSEIRLKFNKKVVQVPCVFTPIEHVPILLGRAGILDKFTVTLDGKKKEIRFEEI
jgi:predicted aspartyl protease